MERPRGVSILSFLQVIGGLLSTLFGALILVLGGLVGADLGNVAATSFYVIGAIVVVLGIAYLIVGYALWEGRSWAWTVNIALGIISLAGAVIDTIVSLASGGPALVILSGLPAAIILSYLTRGHVRAFFGKGLSYNPEIVTNYTEGVMRHLAESPADWAKVLAAFDKSGQTGVVDYLKEQDRDLTFEEARVVALAITSSIEKRSPTVTNTGGSGETNSEREREKEKSWIDKWLQR